MTSDRFDSDAFDQSYKEVELAYSESRFPEGFSQADACSAASTRGRRPQDPALQTILAAYPTCMAARA